MCDDMCDCFAYTSAVVLPQSPTPEAWFSDLLMTKLSYIYDFWKIHDSFSFKPRQVDQYYKCKDGATTLIQNVDIWSTCMPFSELPHYTHSSFYINKHMAALPLQLIN